jgi:hypothetical protein
LEIKTLNFLLLADFTLSIVTVVIAIIAVALSIRIGRITGNVSAWRFFTAGFAMIALNRLCAAYLAYAPDNSYFEIVNRLLGFGFALLLLIGLDGLLQAALKIQGRLHRH